MAPDRRRLGIRTKDDSTVVTYRGPDRRQRVTRPGPLPTRSLASATAQLVGFVSLPTIFLLARGASIASAADLVTVLASLMGAAAGLAAMVQWRVTGLALPGRIGVALVALGIFSLMAGDLPVLGLPVLTSGFGRLISVALVGGGLWRAAHSPEVDSGLAPLRLLTRMAVTGVVMLGALALLLPRILPTDWLYHHRLGQLTDALAAVLWAALGAIFLHRRTTRGRPQWYAVALMFLAAGSAIGGVGGPDSWVQLPASLVIACAMALAAAASYAEASAVLRGRDRHELRLRVDLDDIREELQDERSALQDRLHELRNAVTALRSADSAIREYAERLESAQRQLLADALSNELARLEVLIEPDRGFLSETFDVSHALSGVVVAEQSFGTNITLDSEAVWAQGDPASVAQAVQNLLINARRYAPGCAVRVETSADAQSVEILVMDDGPGIPEDERLRVFLRGARGSTSTGVPGEGLGLYMASRLLAACGGRIRMVDAARTGACFLIELPAATFAERASGTGAPRPLGTGRRHALPRHSDANDSGTRGSGTASATEGATTPSPLPTTQLGSTQ